MRIVPILLAFSWAVASAQAAPTLESVQRQLAAVPVLRGGFQTTRTVTGLAKPLLSSGRFVIAKDHGLIWSQEQPFPQEFVITRTFLRQNMPGAPARTVRTADNPMAAMVGHLLLAMLTGDTREAEQDFKVRFQARSDTAWNMDFTPLRPPLNQMYQAIEVSGAGLVQAVVLTDRQKDRTHIRFENIRPSPEALTDAELAAFRP